MLRIDIHGNYKMELRFIDSAALLCYDQVVKRQVKKSVKRQKTFFCEKEKLTMEFEQLIKERRSVRAYKAEPVAHELLEKIVREAQMAPSWKNLQASRCYVVESPEKLEAFRELALPSFNAKSSAHAALIVTTFVRDVVAYTNGQPDTELGNKWGAYDLGLHDAYLVLAAKNAGLDTLIMGIRNSDAIREALDIPENEDVVSVIAAGYRDQEPAHRPRKELSEVAKFF